VTRNAALLAAVADIERTMKEARDRSPFKDVPLKRAGGLVPGNRNRTKPHGPGRGAVVVTGAEPVGDQERNLTGWSDLYALGRAINEKREAEAAMQRKQAAE
jgi:hypothetical protein